MTDAVFHHEMFVELLRHSGEDADVARAAWVSTMGERNEEGDPERVGGLINMLMRDRHGTPFEQCTLQFRTKAPIAVWREHYRHRIASYNEQSGRYMVLLPEFYVPSEFRPLVQQGKAGAYTFEPGSAHQVEFTQAVIMRNSQEAYDNYESMLNMGVAKEVARLVLPVNIYSTAVVQFNLRSLMHFLSLRTKDSEATYPSFPMDEIRMVADEYEWHFEDKFPLVHAAWRKHGRVAP